MPDCPATLGGLLSLARNRLRQAGIADAALDARLLVEHFTGTARTEAITFPDRPVGGVERKALEEALEQRVGGMPVHRILGQREFYGLTLRLSPETLEPRPDTETLVDLVLAEIRRRGEENREWRILDLGTGTGAIALALLDALPDARAVGVDISAGALATAKTNADMNGYGDRFRTLQSDWFEAVEGHFDLIVSNPPYISEKDWEELAIEVRGFDPRRALVAGPDGLDAYRTIAAESRRFLSAGGVAAVEIGFDQKAAVSQIFARNGYRFIDAATDLGGCDRALIFAPETRSGSA